MPKIVDIDKKKEEITQEAIKVFVQKGYYDTKLSDIAKQCEMGRTTLYQYFKNKDEIFDYAIKNISKSLEDDYYKIINDKSLTILDKIKMMIDSMIMEIEKERNMVIMLIDLWLRLKRENDMMAGKISNRVIELRQVFKQLLEEGIKHKEIKQINPQSMAFTLYALVESFVLQVAFAKNISIEELLKSINVLLDGLKA